MNHCKKCGVPLELNDQYCENCGNEQYNSKLPQDSRKKPARIESIKKHSYLLVFIFIVVLAIGSTSYVCVRMYENNYIPKIPTQKKIQKDAEKKLYVSNLIIKEIIQTKNLHELVFIAEASSTTATAKIVSTYDMKYVIKDGSWILSNNFDIKENINWDIEGNWTYEKSDIEETSGSITIIKNDKGNYIASYIIKDIGEQSRDIIGEKVIKKKDNIYQFEIKTHDEKKLIYQITPNGFIKENNKGKVELTRE